MHDMKKIAKGIEMCISDNECSSNDCPYYQSDGSGFCWDRLAADALALLKEQEKEIMALRLLVEWADECGFGLDNFEDEYNRYKDEIKNMRYIDGMIHVAKRTLEDHGVFEGGL